MSSRANLRQWRAGVWPTVALDVPAVGFPGPVGLWEGVVFMSYDVAERHGWIDDPRLTHPPGGIYGQFEENDRRYETYDDQMEGGRGEIYLTLAEVDLDDPDSIMDFVSTFGYLDVRALDAPRTRQWWGGAAPQSVALRILRYYPGFGDGFPDAALDDSLRDDTVRLVQDQRDSAPTWVVGETIDEFRWAARALRDLRLAWECMRTGADPLQLEWASPAMPGATEPSAAAWAVSQFLQRTVCDALRGFSPRLWLIDAETGRPDIAARPSPAPADVSLFEVLVLELHRHISERAAYKRCENPTCRSLFVRQSGRAEYGQYRTTGVKFCSPRCARTVAQRRYRDRKRGDRQDG